MILLIAYPHSSKSSPSIKSFGHKLNGVGIVIFESLGGTLSW
jgi:hypothetical protein